MALRKIIFFSGKYHKYDQKMLDFPIFQLCWFTGIVVTKLGMFVEHSCRVLVFHMPILRRMMQSEESPMADSFDALKVDSSESLLKTVSLR